MFIVSHLFIYPVKSLGGISVPSALLTDRGFQYDRRWMLIDEHNQFLTQREHPSMALLQTEIAGTGITVFHKQYPAEKILIPFAASIHEKLMVKIWDDYCEAITISKEINEWFSNKLRVSCKLVFMPDDSLRKVDTRYAVNENDITNFSDGYPLLMIGQSSLDDLNNLLPGPLPMNRFRPNIVFTGGEPYEEDEMEHFVIADINFYGVKLCSRCVITTIDQDSLEKSKEPLKTLAGYRTMNNNIYFGQNVLYNKPGIIKIGDELEIVRRKPKPVFEIR